MWTLFESSAASVGSMPIVWPPFFLNTFLGVLVAYPTIINKLPAFGLLSLNWRDILSMIISISIGMQAIPSKGDSLSMWNFIGESDMNFLLKIAAKLIIAPLVLVVFLLNFLSSFLKIDLFYGICVCFFGPKIIEYIFNIGVIREFINGIQSAWLIFHTVRWL